MNRQGAATQMRLCNHDRCIDPTNDLTPHQANTGDPLYSSSVPDAQSERLERSLCLALNERQKG